MSRTSAREHALKVLFSLQFVQDETEKSLDTYLENFVKDAVSEEDRLFMLQEVGGVLTYEKEVDAAISGALKGWSLYRLSKVDLSILRIAVYEILYVADIPKEVSINEAVELAKTYSQEQAPAFINGVLAGVVNPTEDAE